MPQPIGVGISVFLAIVAIGLIAGIFGFYGAGYGFAVLLMLTLILVLFLVLCRLLADVNLFFTLVKEGTAKSILRGKEFSHHIMAFEGHHLNDPRKPGFVQSEAKWQVLPDRAGVNYDDRPWFMRWLGIYWIGIPPFFSVYEYHFEWNEITLDKEGKEKLWSREGLTDFIFVADFTYAMVLNEAETGGEEGNLPVDLLYLVTVAIRNPYRALFSGEDWLKRVGAATNRVARNWVGSRSFEQLRSETDEPGEHNKDSFSYQIICLNERLPDDRQLADEPSVPDESHGLVGRYGVLARTADLQSVDLTGSAGEQLRAATTRQYVARQEGEAKRIESEGEARAIVNRGEAEAKVIERKGQAQAQSLSDRLEVIERHGDAGRELAQVDAMSADVPGKTVIWANSPFKK